MIANASCWITSQYNTANLVLLWQSDPMIDVESEFLPRHFLWTIIQFYSPCMSRSSLGLQSDITRQRYQPGDPHLSWHWIMLFYLYRFPDQDALYEQDKLSSYVDTVWAGCCLVQCRVQGLVTRAWNEGFRRHYANPVPYDLCVGDPILHLLEHSVLVVS